MRDDILSQQNELVSIITPMHNSELFIRETIESVISQTYQNWEMIIVDDFSNDKSLDIVQEYAAKDKRIIAIPLSQKSSNGPIDVRNKGIEVARGRFIAFLDSDDLWDKNKLEVQLSFMLEGKIAFSYCNYRIYDDVKKIIKSEFAAPAKATYNDICKGNYIGCLAAMYDTAMIGKIYIVNAPKREDFATWLAILKKVPCAHNVSQTLATYRLRPYSVSSKKRRLIKHQWYVYRKIEKIGFLKSTYYLMATIINKLFKY
ncbi:MAG: glycosyltransferase family 2 protein [Bacilli bacterium]|jgi:glycosyltransferase involved in cell wall biosynthesis